MTHRCLYVMAWNKGNLSLLACCTAWRFAFPTELACCSSEPTTCIERRAARDDQTRNLLVEPLPFTFVVFPYAHADRYVDAELAVELAGLK